MKGTLRMKAGYMGAGFGLAAFAIYGMMPGAFVGGVAALEIGRMTLAEGSLMARAIVAGGMLAGSLGLGMLAMACGGLTGWALGRSFELYREHAETTTTHNALSR